MTAVAIYRTEVPGRPPFFDCTLKDSRLDGVRLTWWLTRENAARFVRSYDAGDGEKLGRLADDIGFKWEVPPGRKLDDEAMREMFVWAVHLIRGRAGEELLRAPVMVTL